MAAPGRIDAIGPAHEHAGHPPAAAGATSGHDQPRHRTRRLGWMLAVNTVLVAGQLAGGILGHSTGLLADAGHNLADSVAVGGAMAAVRIALRPRDAAHTFGHHRATILSALGSAALTAVVTVAIVGEAIDRLLHPAVVDGAIVAVVAGAAFVIDAGAAALLLGDHHDLNLRATMLHFVADAAASVGVLVAGLVLVAAPGVHWADPAAALLVAAIILVETVRLLRDIVVVLLESSPADVDLDLLADTMAAVDGVADVHDLHVWSLSSEVRALSAHVQVAGHPTLEQAQAVGEGVKDAVRQPFAIAHATIELECERCDEDAADPCAVDGLVPPGRAAEPAGPAPRAATGG